MLTFQSGNLSVKDLSNEDIRVAMGFPKLYEGHVAYHTPTARSWSISDHQALVNAETGQLYKIASPAYRVVRHEDGLRNVMEAVEKNPEFGKIEWTAKDYNDGQRVLAKGRFVDVDYEVKKGDLINPTIEYSNSYDSSWTERIVFGAYRLICKNGLTIGERFMVESAKHIGHERDHLFIDLDKALHSFSIQTDLWKGWLDKELAISHLDSVEELDLTKKEHQEVVDDVSKQRNVDLWMFYNILTALITHKIVSLNRQVKTWSRLQHQTRNW